MQCPNCNSQNVKIGIPKPKKQKTKSKKGIMYWLFIGWWLVPIILIFKIFFKIIVVIFKKPTATCLNCGYQWTIKTANNNSIENNTSSFQPSEKVKRTMSSRDKIVLTIIGSVCALFAIIIIAALAASDPDSRKLETTDEDISESIVTTAEIPATTSDTTTTTTELTTTTEKTTTTKETTTTTARQTTTRETTTKITTTTSDKREYVLNNSTMKFHYPGCNSVDDILPSNRSDVTAKRDDLISQGYDPCGRCKP